MPLVYDQAIWEALYGGVRDGVYTRGYTRDRLHSTAQLQEWQRRRMDYVGGGQLQNASVLHIGCAFGWMMEHALDLGVDSWGLDASPYCQANVSTEARADVVPRILYGYTIGVDSSNSIKNALAGIGAPRTYAYIITEDVVGSQADAELPAFFTGCEDLLQGNVKGRIIHMVTPLRDGRQDSSLNWKSMADWKAFAPDHTWIDVTTGEQA